MSYKLDSTCQHPESPRTLNQVRIKRDIIVIGASAGGIPPLQRLFAAWPATLAATVGVVLHRTSQAGQLASVLARHALLPVIEPRDGEPLRQKIIFLAPPDHHMLFEHGVVSVRQGPKECHSRPAVNPLFRSAATGYGVRVVGVLLSGCGEDGVNGMTRIEDGGGICLAQDPREAEMPYMPLNAIRYDDVSGVFRTSNLASVLEALTEGKAIGNTQNEDGASEQTEVP
jgi:two-component system chemotaxis response regulator CheB